MSRITSKIMGNFAKKVANAKPALPLSVQKGFAINSELAKVIVAVPESLQHRVSEAEVASAFEGMGMRYLPGSFVRAHESDRSLFAAITTTKKQVIVGETAASAGLTEVASNVFTDDQDNVWEMKNDNGRTMFVCTAADDIQVLLNANQSRSITTASVEVAATEGFVGGDAVYFYDVANETATFGIAVDSKSVYLTKEDRIQEVASSVVLASTSGMGAGAGTKGDIIDYMRKVYGSNAEFFNKLRGLIEANLAV